VGSYWKERCSVCVRKQNIVLAVGIEFRHMRARSRNDEIRRRMKSELIPVTGLGDL
jgi:hypothetical protein